MRLFCILSVLLSTIIAKVSGDDCNAPDTVTQLDFFSSTLVTNTLHIPNGELRYEGTSSDFAWHYHNPQEHISLNLLWETCLPFFVFGAPRTGIGTFQSDVLDLTVTLVPGVRSDYTNIAGYWVDRNKTAEEVNGKRDGGSFGNINLQTKKGVPHSGEGTFEFCIVDTGTNNPVTIANFSFAIWDLDWRKNETITPGVAVKEKLIVDTGQALRYEVFPDFTESEVTPICEDGTYPTCTDVDCSLVHPGHQSCPGQQTVFRASEFGTGPDNPYTPENITDSHRKRAVNFFFEDTSCFVITYAHYCQLEDDANSYDWPLTQDQTTFTECNMGLYSGGNFLFSGESDALYYEQGCPTGAPTIPPSGTPTIAPSPAPTSLTSEGVSTFHESDALTVHESDAPTVHESDAPTETPYEAECASGAGSATNLGQLNLCLRTSLGYSYSNPSGTATTYQEVNFIESLIRIEYDMTSGFCVTDFAVSPKEKELTTITKEYGLVGYLCNPAITTTESDIDSGRTRQKPTQVTDYDKPSNTETFNQGALISVCVVPDDDTWVEGVVMESVDEFTWTRDPHPLYPDVLTPLTQNAITNGVGAGNLLTVYNPPACDGADFCEFHSVLFADYYYNPGAVTGTGQATMKFPGARRNLNEVEDGVNGGRYRGGRRLQEQEETQPFDMLVMVNGMDDGPGKLRAAGASFGWAPALVASFVAVIANLCF